MFRRDEGGDGGGEAVSVHVVAGNFVDLAVEGVAAAGVLAEAAGAEDDPGEAALAQVVFGFGFGEDGFAEGLFEHGACAFVLFAAAHAGYEHEAGLGGGAAGSFDDVDVA